MFSFLQYLQAAEKRGQVTVSLLHPSNASLLISLTLPEIRREVRFSQSLNARSPTVYFPAP
jgi:hypothetical protein